MSDLALQLIAENKKKYENGEDARRLDIGNCGLNDFPKDLFDLVWLEELIVSNYYQDNNRKRIESPNKGSKNRIIVNTLPALFINLKFLKKLFIGGDDFLNAWEIKDISILEKLPQLNSLYLSYNQISDYSFLENLSQLNSLYLSDNQISDYSFLENLSQLNYLDLRGNQISDINSLEKLSQLSSLELSSNQISDISSLEKISQLNYLDLSNNQISDISPLEKLSQLNYLYLRGNQITDISSLEKLSQLNSLNLSDNQISDISSLEKLSQLNSLYLSFNEISDISPLEKLSQLNSLYLSFNEISDISSLEKLSQLNYLDLSDNQISNISSLEKLSQLNSLDLSFNEISDISSLKKLLRKSFINIYKEWTGGGGIVIEDNPLKTPPMHVVEEGREAVLRYFDSLKESGNTYNNEVKLIIVGNGTAGKSSLAKYLKDNIITKEIDSTEGLSKFIWEENFDLSNINEQKKKPEKTKVKFRVFDFGGQDYYHDSHHILFTEKAIYIVVWEKASEAHFIKPTSIKLKGQEEIIVDMDHHPVEYWLDAIDKYQNRERKPKEIQEDTVSDRNESQFGEKKINQKQQKQRNITPILVVQNKTELDGIVFKNAQALKRKYPHVYDFAAISVYEDKRLKFLKQNLIQEMLDEMGFVGATYPTYYERIKDYIETKKAFSLDREKFYETCKNIAGQNGFKAFTEENYHDVIDYLRHLGLVSYFAENKELENKVFIQPEAILQKIYQVLNKGLEKNNGEINRSEIKRKLNNNTDAIIAIMQHFKMIFPIPGKDDSYIAPQYLPAKVDRKLKLFLHNFSKPLVRFNFNGFIHKSILLDFFADYGSYVLKDETPKGFDYYFWKNGIVIEKYFEGIAQQALVTFSGAQHIDETTNIHTLECEAQRIDICIMPSCNYNQLVREIEGKLDEICDKWEVDKHYSFDGNVFAKASELEKANDNKHSHIVIRNKQYRLGLFRDYIKDASYGMKKMFICYSSRDRKYLGELETHLAPLKNQSLIDTWNDLKLESGELWDERIMDELEEADIVLVLASPNLLDTHYVVNKELPKIIELQENRGTQVIPIALDYCQFDQVFPEIQYVSEKKKDENRKDGKTDILIINDKTNRNEAWFKVIEHIKEIIGK